MIPGWAGDFSKSAQHAPGAYTAVLCSLCNLRRSHRPRSPIAGSQGAQVAPTRASKRTLRGRVGHIELEHFPAPNQPAWGCRTEGHSALLDSVAFDLESAPTRPDNQCTTGRTVVLPPSSGQFPALSPLYRAPPARTCVMQCLGVKMLAPSKAGHKRFPTHAPCPETRKRHAVCRPVTLRTRTPVNDCERKKRYVQQETVLETGKLFSCRRISL